MKMEGLQEVLCRIDPKTGKEGEKKERSAYVKGC